MLFRSRLPAGPRSKCTGKGGTRNAKSNLTGIVKARDCLPRLYYAGALGASFLVPCSWFLKATTVQERGCLATSGRCSDKVNHLEWVPSNRLWYPCPHASGVGVRYYSPYQSPSVVAYISSLLSAKRQTLMTKVQTRAPAGSGRWPGSGRDIPGRAS